MSETKKLPETILQRAYYAATAEAYNQAHVGAAAEPEHDLAACVMAGLVDGFGIRSLLDVGAGTGRALLQIRRQCPEVRLLGIEPVPELREQGYKAGLSAEELVDGDAMQLPYPDCSFDMVCEFGVLHHLRQPKLAVAEMLRVAKHAVFISDSNNFGAGSKLARTIKQSLRSLRLWSFVDWLNTRGKGYHFSEGDGVYYSFSVFDHYDQITKACRHVHVINTRGSGKNSFCDASHVAVFGLKHALEQ